VQQASSCKWTIRPERRVSPLGLTDLDQHSALRNEPRRRRLKWETLDARSGTSRSGRAGTDVAGVSQTKLHRRDERLPVLSAT
jgi:hypothetical protein